MPNIVPIAIASFIVGITAVGCMNTKGYEGANAGKQLVEQRCSKCHAIGRSGVSPHKDAPPFAEVVKRYPPKALEEALAEGIEVGHEDMPPFAFKADEVEQIIAYLKRLE